MGFLQASQFGLVMPVAGGDGTHKEMNEPRGNSVCHQSVGLDIWLGECLTHFL